MIQSKALLLITRYSVLSTQYFVTIVAMLLSLTAGVGAAVFAGFHTMWPTSQLYGRTFVSEGRSSKRLALTYDDGPNDPYTQRLLDVLGKHNVKATFFVIGQYVKQRPDIARAVAGAGHAIANHTYTHPNLALCSSRRAHAEVASCEVVLQEAIGPYPRLFRPPHGGRHPGTLRAVREMGYVPVMWSVSSYDWSARSSAQIVERVSNDVRGGDVILMHDGGHLQFGTDRSYTIAASDEIIRRYKGEGFQFVTIPEMVGVPTGVAAVSPNA